ncbi:unnamed protein product [Oikopleura dioica]|uniref:Uncharacterized protein n=1 Tax=Oikopleura dioica TaxID=34765 RepID=E4XAN1_OIKDI|nr:unnamed protein product [Oikopleura dioica]
MAIIKKNQKSYIDVENSHCWNPTHDLLVTCPDRLDGTTPMCLSELRVMKTNDELELVDLKKDCFYGFEPEITILRQDVCRENFCNTFALPKDPELMLTAQLTSKPATDDEFGLLSCITCAGKQSCLSPTLRMRTSATEVCEPYFGWPGCYMESWMNENGELDSIRRGCYDFSQNPGQSFTEFIHSSKCTDNKCNFDKFDFRSKFSENIESSGDDSDADDEDIEETFFSTTEKEIDDQITNVVTIGTESYETSSGDNDYASGSGDGEEFDSIYIPQIIRNDLFYI